MYDLVIQNGRLMDPQGEIEGPGDIAVQGRKIVAVGQLLCNEAKQIVDASGCYVTPGLIDFHCHIALGVTDFAMPADLVQIPHGVTSLVDAGSVGAANFETFYRNNVANSQMTVKSFLHVSTMGLLTHRFTENIDPQLFDRERIKMLCEQYPDQIIGLKLRQSKDIVGSFGLEPLRETVALADEIGLPISVHASDSPGEVQETLEHLRPGDIFCHMYHQKGKTILDENGRVLSEVWTARERGVLFDLGHGAFNFSGKVAVAAIKQGFLPDIISSDLSLLSLYKAPTHSFTYVLSELLNLGVSFREIIRRCTDIPGKLMGIAHNGFLRVGQIADIAVFKIVEQDIHYVDRYNNEYAGNQLIQTQMTIKNGSVLYRNETFL